MKAKQNHLSIIFTVFLAAAMISILIPSTQADITNGLVTYWPFNEGTGITAYDFSNYNNNGVISNCVWVNGKIGSGLAFNGVNSEVVSTQQLTYNTSKYGYTLSAWIKLSGNSNSFYSICGIYPEQLGLILIAQNSSIGAFANGNNGVNINVGSLLNAWHLVTAVFYTNVTGWTPAKIYLDGVYVGDSVTDRTAPTSGIGSFSTSKSYSGYDTHFCGSIDDVRIYERSLSASEVAELYYYPGAIPTPTSATYPSSTPIASPVFVNSISSSPLWQYLYAWDLVGFVIATWTFSLGQSFFVIVAFIVSLSIYIRYQNLIAISIIWIVLGSVFVVWIPMVTPFIIFAFAFGFGSLLYKVYEARN